MFHPYSEQKSWGTVQHIFANDHAAVSLLDVTAGYRCSKHYHRYRANMFCVQSGRIVVETWGDDGKKASHEMGPGDTFTVASGIWHRFRVLESGKVVEVYWSDRTVDLHDIERADVGGPDCTP